MAGTARVEQAGWWGGIVSLLLIGAGFFAIDAGGTNGPDAPVDLLVNDIVSMEDGSSPAASWGRSARSS